MNPGVAGVVQPGSYNQTRRECTNDEGYGVCEGEEGARRGKQEAKGYGKGADTEHQTTRKKLNPLETLRRAKLEEKITSKVKASSKVHRQQKEQQRDGEDMDKNDEGTQAKKGGAPIWGRNN